MPNSLPYGQKLVSTFPEALSSAIIGPSLRSHLGHVGLYTAHNANRSDDLGVALVAEGPMTLFKG